MDRDLEREIDRLMGTTGPGGRGPAAPAAGGPGSGLLRGRRLLVGLILAVVEVVVLLVMRPGWLGVALPMLVLALCVWLWLRLRAGLLKDLVGVVALAQALVVAVPLAIAVSVGVGLVVGLGVLVALALVVFRGARGRRR